MHADYLCAASVFLNLGYGHTDVMEQTQGLRFNVDLVLRRSVLTLKLWKC